MITEIIKIVLPFLGGGVAGAILNEWFRRRSGRLQEIPLIERVNRLVGPELTGFTLARVTGTSSNPHLEEVKNVREYQLTLRNTSSIHLQDVEIQFEFPTEDVEAWASRPARSKTAPVPVEAIATAPWRKGFRWRIPHLPSSDSIEFSFKAVNPPSDDYEVALYKSDRVVIERSKGEPTARRSSYLKSTVAIAVIPLVLGLGVGLIPQMFPDSESKTSTFSDGGCTFTVNSTYVSFGTDGAWPWSKSPWRITNRVVNIGVQKCTIQSEQFNSAPTSLSAGQDLQQTAYSIPRPRLKPLDVSFGAANANLKTQVPLYVDPQR